MDGDRKRGQDVEADAAEWVIRSNERPLDEAERAAFEAWLRRDPAHRTAFENAHATWIGLAVLRHEAEAGASSTRHLAETPMSAPPPRASPRLRMAAALAATLALALGAGVLYRVGDPFVAMASDYRTAPAEVRTITLADGSTVELGPASAISIQFSDDVRQVTLLAGDAFFTATPRQGPELRPFAVRTQGGVTRALGTRFVIENMGPEVQVTAVEHRIEVSVSDERQRASSVVLSPGETVAYAPEGPLGPVRHTDAAGAAAWRRGLLVFDAVPLRSVVTKLNRYRRGRIVIMSPALAERRVSGVFAADDLNDVVETIATELNARTVAAPPFVTLLF